MLFTVSCRQEVVIENGQTLQCVGLFDDKNPKLIYKIDTYNIIIGAFFINLVFPPIIVIVDEFFCPIGYKMYE